jgi:histidyl-tRNA synthetase
VFEVKVRALGAQDAIGGGGRYDGLARVLGGPEVPGVGFAAGMERIVLLLERSGFPRKDTFRVYLAPQDEEGEKDLLALSQVLHEAGIPFCLDFASKSLRYHLKRAQKMGVRFVVIAGEEERKNEGFSLKDLVSGEQMLLSREELLGRLRKERKAC